MADVGVQYDLVTPGGTVNFNVNAGHYEPYITEIQGLGSPVIRAPIDNVPYGDGAIVHDFWKGPRHVIVDGVFLVRPRIYTDDEVVQVRNDMEEDLRVALESILQADGTFVWAPQGQPERTLTVRNDVPLECSHEQNYLLRTFSFGLVAADPDWVEST